VGNWSLTPVSDPDRLRLMRCLYRNVVGCPQDGECGRCKEGLERFFGPDWAMCAAPAGWFGVGCKKDVPRDACAVGQYRGTYVWVTPAGRPYLTLLTFAVLDSATRLLVHPAPPSKEVITYHYEGDVLQWQERRTVVDPVQAPPKLHLDEKELKGLRSLKPEELPAAPRPVERLHYFDPTRGLFFLPR
jgi:hypothetical protein